MEQSDDYYKQAMEILENDSYDPDTRTLLVQLLYLTYGHKNRDLVDGEGEREA